MSTILPLDIHVRVGGNRRATLHVGANAQMQFRYKTTCSEWIPIAHLRHLVLKDYPSTEGRLLPKMAMVWKRPVRFGSPMKHGQLSCILEISGTSCMERLLGVIARSCPSVRLSDPVCATSCSRYTVYMEENSYIVVWPDTGNKVTVLNMCDLCAVAGQRTKGGMSTCDILFVGKDTYTLPFILEYIPHAYIGEICHGVGKAGLPWFDVGADPISMAQFQHRAIHLQGWLPALEELSADRTQEAGDTGAKPTSESESEWECPSSDTTSSEDDWSDVVSECSASTEEEP